MMKKYVLMLAAIALSSNAFSQASPLVHVNIDAPYAVCDPEACVTLTASLANARETTGYDVSQINYQILYPLVGGTVIPTTDEDMFAPAFPLGFDFCFYGNTYSSIYVGTNGVIAFELPNPQSNFCSWSIGAGSVPGGGLAIRNAIYGVYQDTDIRLEGNDIGTVTDPQIQNVNYYTGGTAPNRYLVVNFNELPLFYCGSDAGLQTSQIVLYESSNVIDVYVKNRSSCDTWQNGRGIIGVQNAAGTLATVPSDRAIGNWDAANEAWRFSPNGAEFTQPSYEWSKNGVSIENQGGNSITVCEEAAGDYNVTISYTNCSGTQSTATETVTITDGMAEYAGIADPVDLSVCSDVETAVFNLDTNTPLVLGAVDPAYFEVLYYNTYEDAVNYASNNITGSALTSYTGFDGENIYIRISNLNSATDCAPIKSFELEIEPFTVTPEGENEQDFEAGDTLEDLEVDGENVSWWDAPTEGNELPETTPLVDGATYYAESENENGCPNTENRMAAQRLAVTVTQVALGTPGYENIKLTVAPNPVKDVLSVNSQQNITSLEIYNLIGQRVLNTAPGTPQAQINMSGLPTGSYLMKVYAGDKVKTIKLIKE